MQAATGHVDCALQTGDHFLIRPDKHAECCETGALIVIPMEALRTFRSLRQRLQKRHQAVMNVWVPYPQSLWSRLWIT
ncbi:hypothetical protein EMIT051CA3_80197 [Pseudomonas chlororaphis]